MSVAVSTNVPVYNEMAVRLAQHSPADFAFVASGGQWDLAPHLDLINDRLLKIVNGEISRLMVFLPPRNGKSELISKYFPAWFLGMFPDKKVILTSYEADFAAQWGRRARDLLEEWGGLLFPERITVHQNSSAASRWDIQGHSGGMVTAGVGGPITGKGGHLIIIDDPLKNDKEAASETIRDRQKEWFKSTLYTRLEPEGAIILIMTRWHEDDLGGWLTTEMQQGGEKWDVICLPAIAEEHDLLGRSPGDPLWSDRFPLDTLMKIKRTLGSYWWNALYLQRPSPVEGEIFKRQWWRYYQELPCHLGKFDEIIQSWDCAFKDTSSSDYVVGQVWGRLGADRYLIDQVRGRMDLPATIAAILSLSTKYERARRKLIEDKANGPAVIQLLKRRLPGLIAVEPEGGKVARAMASTAEIESGNVYLPAPEVAPWIGEFIEECAAFPTGRHDDQVDAMTQAMIWMNQHDRQGEIPIEDVTIGPGRGIPGFDDDLERIGY